jgi:hypothetical protein
MNLDLKKLGTLIGLEAAAVASWGLALPNWEAVQTPAGVFSLVGTMASVLLAWLGQSPRRI